MCKIFFIVLLFPLLYTSQIPGLINYTEKDGLKSSLTYSLSQDAKGFIWIGSDNGLFRFDGIEFKQFEKKDGLKNIDILGCEPLSNGENFIIPFLNDFAYLKANKIINSDINPELKKIKFEIGTALCKSYKNKVILCHNNNPNNIFIYENEKVTEINIKHSPDNAFIRRPISFDFNNDILYLQKGSLIISYSIRTRIETILGSVSFGDEIAFVKNNLFISKNKNFISLYLLQNHHLKKIAFYKASSTIFQVILDRNNDLWVSLHDGGILYFKNRLKESEPLNNPVKLLDQYIISSILRDKDNNIWFSTRNDGLLFLSSASFQNYINLPLNKNSSYITSIASNNKNIFLGYNICAGGIYDSEQLKDIVFVKNRKLETVSIYANKQFAYFAHSDGFFEYNILTNKVQTIGNVPYVIKNIIPYHENSMLICNSLGIDKYNLSSRTHNILWNKRTYTALPYTNDSIFAGTFKDLYKLNIQTKEYNLFLEGYYFTDIKKLRNNLFVGSTNLNGVIIFNNKKVLKKINTDNGLIINKTKNITIENDHTFWVSTTAGLVRIKLTKSKPLITNFTIIDGLPSDKVAGCIIKDDNIFIGTSKGLGIFSIKKLLTQQKYIDKKVIINSIIIGKKEYNELSLGLTGKTPENNVTFNLSFLDYVSQGKISYKYNLQGLNNIWETTKSSKVIFSSLPPGKYIFKVYGLGYNNKQSLTYTQFPFEIFPRFWQTEWFKVIVGLAIVIFLSILINFYSQKKRSGKLKNILIEKKIAELELQAIKAQINPHFIYNCLNSIRFLLCKEDYQEADDYLSIFSQMIRKTLHYSEKTFITIQEEVEYLSLYLDMEKLRLKEQFEYEIKITEKVNTKINIPSLLVQPFVENALKHGISSLTDRKGDIKISVDMAVSDLCITIEDNGIGFTNNIELTEISESFGVRLSQKRIDTFKQLFNTNIVLEINNLLETQQQPGTQVKLIIPTYEYTNTSLHH